MEPIDIWIDDIYIPAKHRRRTVNKKAVEELAESILEAGMKAPILVRTKRPATVFYDSERDEFGAGVERHSNEHYLGWLLGLMGVAALIGFTLAVATFIYSFMRVKARSPHWACALGAAVIVMMLGVLAHFLTLVYPEGLLQNYVTLPWPLA